MLENVEVLREWISGALDASSSCIALVDPSRYRSSEACAHALGMSSEAFDALPNLYAKFGKSIRELGPRLWNGHPADPLWGKLLEEAFERQAASFLIVPEHGDRIEDHLLGLIRMPQPDGGNLLFRFQDVVVLSALRPLLTATQQRGLLGPARHWWMVDLCRHAVRIDAPDTSAQSTTSLRLDQRQIDALGEALFPLTIIHQANETDSALLARLSKCERVGLIRERMRNAREHGLSQQEDIALYCVLSLQLPEGFDREGPVADALLEARAHGIGFGEAIDGVPMERWRAMDDLLDIGPPDSSPH